MKNLTVAVREVGEQVVFLRKLVEGGASRSYGIEVAKLAGLPAEVLARAREILTNLEAMEVDERGHAMLAHERRRRSQPAAQLGLFASHDPAAAENPPGAGGTGRGRAAAHRRAQPDRGVEAEARSVKRAAVLAVLACIR